MPRSDPRDLRLFDSNKNKKKSKIAVVGPVGMGKFRVDCSRRQDFRSSMAGENIPLLVE